MTKTEQPLADALSRFDRNPVLRRLLDTGLIGVLLVSEDGRVVFANDACCKMTGFERAELLARNDYDLLHPDDLEACRHDRRQVMEDNAASIEFERRYVRKDGQTLWTKGSISLLPDIEADGPPILAYLITDITSLKQAELEREHLYITLHSIGDAVICTDTQSLVTFMNPVAERLTGWAAADAAGHAVGDIFYIIEERSGKAPASPVDQCMRDRRALTVESGMILLSRTGDAFDIGFSAAPVRTAEGVLGSIVIFNDLTKVSADQRRVARSALHDALTGLPNRSAFMRKLEGALIEAREEGRAHALCFIDLDRFKLVNDRGGHAAGDALLTHVAKIIALSCSSKDMPARLGGDEFAVLIRDCTASEAEKTAHDIVQAISDIEFRWETELFRIGASIGATMITDACTGLADMLNQADRACYRAKNSGRGQVVCIQNPKPKAVSREISSHPSKSLNIH